MALPLGFDPQTTLVPARLRAGFSLATRASPSHVRPSSACPGSFRGNSLHPQCCLRAEGVKSGALGSSRLRPSPRGTERLGLRRESGPKVVVASLGGDPGAAGQSGGIEQTSDVVELPLFPLPLVLFPGSIVPLQIFEYRYRIMIQTLLQTNLRFGIVFSGGERGTVANVGCVGQIVRHERLPDDRYFVICKGEERFRVMDVVRTRPYLVGRVTWLEDRPSPSGGLGPPREQGEGGGGLEAPSDLDTLANEVASIMSNVIRLTRKMRGGSSGKGESKSDDETAPLDMRRQAFPTPFSFWVASTFEGLREEQQALLEIVDTAERLERERETLRNTLNYLTATAALRDAFPPSTDTSSSP